MEKWKKALEFIRGMVRPYITVTGWSSILYMAVKGLPIPEFLLAFVSALTGWLFAERALRHNSTPPPGP